MFRHLHKPNFPSQVYTWWHLPWRLQQGEISLRFDYDPDCHSRPLCSVTQHTWDLSSFQEVKAALLPVTSVKLTSASTSLSPSVWDSFWFLGLLSQNQTVLLLLFSCSVVSDSLWPPWTAKHQASLFFTISQSLLNSCSLTQRCHQTISSSAVPFSSCIQSFPASGSFQMSQLFTAGGQSIGASVSASVLPMNIWFWFPWGLIGLISLQSKGLSKVFSNTTVQKHQFFSVQPFLLSSYLICTWLLEKP